MKSSSGGNAVKLFCMRNAVPIVFLVVSAIGIYYSQFTAEYLIQEMLTRLARNSFLVLSLLIPIMAGMGLNFGMVLGAMAGQIGLRRSPPSSPRLSPFFSDGCAAWCSTRPAVAKWSRRTFSASS